MAERRPDVNGVYPETLISSKIFAYKSRYKQRNRVLFFRKPIYRFAIRCECLV